jgi:mannosyltransferase OCH1-like enzyme
MIPKIFHNIWLGQKKMPEEFIVFHDNWKNLHSDWEYKLWKDEDIHNLNPSIKKLIDESQTFSSKSNILRIYLLYEYGGVYADTDFDWNKSLNPLLNNLAFIPKPTYNVYNSAILGSIKKHNWFKLMLENLKHFARRPPPWGPDLITSTLVETLDAKNVTIVPRKYFYPYLWTEESKPASFFPNSYGVHHWYKSWRSEYVDPSNDN